MPFPLHALAAVATLATLPLLFLPQLPEVNKLILLLFMALLLIALPVRFLRYTGTGIMLFVWASLAAHQALEPLTELTKKNIMVRAEITQFIPDKQRLIVRIDKYHNRRIFPPVYASVTPGKLERAWCVGQRWQMNLRLRPVHGRLNEGSFDAQRFALANHVPLQGKLLAAELLSQDCSWRQQLINHARKQYHALPWHSVMTALLFGERQDLTAKTRTVLRDTGIAHLMAISGMHITLAASLGWMAARGMQFFIPAWRIRYPFPLLLSLSIAAVYCWLSGNSPPALRAMTALALWGLVRLQQINCRSWQIWLICMGGILFFDPLTVLSDSFWLSVLAVAILLFWFNWFPLPAQWRYRKRWMLLQLAHLQVGIMLLLLPVQVFIFHGISLTSLPANMLAIPVITFVTVPALLLALILSADWLALPLWLLADRSLALVFHLLSFLPAGWLWLGKEALSASLILWLLLIAFRLGWWRRAPIALITVCCLPGLWHAARVEPRWRLDMLDIGHGLAIVISRHGHAVIYDTGNRWPGGSAAQQTILPWLNWQGLIVDEIIISHQHLDHIGGLADMQLAWPDAIVRSALTLPAHAPCVAGMQWQWQGLHFNVLWPLKRGAQGNNNDSCVLHINDGHYQVLLTGDLESDAERALLRRDRFAIKADIVQVPHHGSKTSSTAPFLRNITGSLALASAARYNAWRLPSAQIINRYIKSGYSWRDTAHSGQLSVEFYPDKWQVKGLREQIMPRWYHQWFGVQGESR